MRVIALLTVLACPMALAEPVRCAKGQETIYQNAPCPLGYVTSGLSPSLSIIDSQRPKLDQLEGKTERRATHHIHAKTPRDPKKVREFRSLYPCPATLEETGPCIGYVVDHIKPLACGGPDDFSNMQWQTVKDAKAKDGWELQCLY